MGTRKLLALFDLAKPHPPVNCLVIIDQREWRVVSVDDITPGCQSVLWTMDVREG